MNILLLVQKKQRVILDRLYDAIARYATNCDTRWLDDTEQANLSRYFAQHVDTTRYDRIIFFLRFKKEIRQRAFIWTVPNLVFLEHDASQNYGDGKYNGEFSRHYRALPWARILCSGYSTTQRLCAEGFDAWFVPKGYDQQLLHNLDRPRTIELAFVGSTRNQVYKQRGTFLQQLAAREPLEIVRTNSGQDYLDKLNSIRFFVSADIGIGEYTIKNFEAMACGCVLLAYNQGESENHAVGFVDMNNIVLYSNIDELCAKLAVLRDNPKLCERIAAAGQRLAEEYFSFDRVGKKMIEALRTPLRQPGDYPATTVFGEFRLRVKKILEI